MHRIIILITLLSFIATQSILAQQCNQYQIHIIESVSEIYDVSDDIYETKIELNRLVTNLKDDKPVLNYQGVEEQLKSMKNNIGLTETSLEIALSNADMCGCLNGQIQSDELLVEIDKLKDYSKELLKLLKSIKKIDDFDEIAEMFDNIDKLLNDSNEICEKVSEKAVKSQNICY